jgi:hypothetical protein
MTTDHELDRVLDRWFAQRAVEADGRVIDIVVGRIERQGQLPVWRASWRDTHVNGSIKPLAAIAAVVAISVVGIAFAVKPFGPSVGATATASPPPSASPSVAPTDASAPTPTPPWNRYPVCGSGTPPCAGPIGPGTYTSSGFSVPVTYTLTTPWVNTSDWPETFLLYPDTPANRVRGSTEDAGAPPNIQIAPRAAVSPSDACPEPHLAPDATRVDANEFRDHLQSRDGVSVTGARPITLGGLRGQQLDVTVEPGWTGCLPHTYGENPPEDPIRYIVLDHPNGDSLVITLWAPVDFDEFLAEAMPVVESFEFDASN